MSSRAARWLRPAIVVLVLLGAAWAAYRFRRGAGPDLPTAVAQRGEFLVTLPVRGTLEAQRSVELHAPNVSGLTIIWLAPDGSVVPAHQPVARFDSSTARQQETAKAAALRQAQAALDQAVATQKLNAQQDQLDLATAQTAVASAELDASKQAILSPIDGAESQLALDMAKEKLKVEEANIAAHVAADGAKIASARSNQVKAQADLDLVQSQLQQMELITPITGVITYLTNYSQGWVNAKPFKVGDSVWATAEIAEVPDLSTLELTAKVPEIDRGQVAVGDAIHLQLDALPELALTGKVGAISTLAEADFSGVWPPPQIFRVACTVDPAASGQLDPRLRPEMNGNITVVTQRLENAISVPSAALFPINGNPVVYVQHGRHFEPQPVRIIAHNVDYDAITGLAAGERVALTDPNQRPTP